MAALKSGPYLVHGTVNILLLVLLDQQEFSEKSEKNIGLDSYILNSLNYLSIIWIYIINLVIDFFAEA